MRMRAGVLGLSGWKSGARRQACGAACLLCAAMALAAQTTPEKTPPPTSQRPAARSAQTGSASRSRKAASRRKAKPSPAVAAVAAPPAAPEPPPMPAWPVNDRPTPAAVTWDQRGLRIAASNSSLQQILNEVGKETGARVEGLSSDQRVFGEYGPGAARDVLAQILQGSGYNFILVGDNGQGAPREIVLSAGRGLGAGAPLAAPRTPTPQMDETGDDDSDNPVDTTPEPPPPPQPVRPNFPPEGQARTPQQMQQPPQTAPQF